jgi:hypothetical protein
MFNLPNIEDWEFDFAADGGKSSSKPGKELINTAPVKKDIMLWNCYICGRPKALEEGAATTLNERENLLIHYECKKFNIDDNKY